MVKGLIGVLGTLAIAVTIAVLVIAGQAFFITTC
jgi:hypothetical protein